MQWVGGLLHPHKKLFFPYLKHCNMPNRKVIAYFMHEREEAICSSLINNQQRTDSYYIGEVDDASLQQLKDQNIIVQVIEQNQAPLHEQMGVRKITRGRSIANKQLINIDAIKSEQETAGFPAYYKFFMDGPLLETYRSQLQAADIEISEFLPPDAYLVRIESQTEFNALQQLSFIKNVTFYSSGDTGINVVSRDIPGKQDEGVEKKMLTFDILLHRPDDLPNITMWLNEKNIPVAGASGKKIRVYLLEDSPLQEEIAKNTAVQSFDEYIAPRFHNDMARTIIGLNTFTPAANPGITYTGDGQIVGVADTGIDEHHPDFNNQIHKRPVAWGRVNDYSDFNGHGTHVAGSIVGNGTSSGGNIKGTAPGAKVFFQSIMDANGDLRLPLQLQTLFQEAYDNGARIHNNSWGSATRSRYTVNAIEVDDFVARNRDMLLIFSAGNEGNALQPQNVPEGFSDLFSIGSPGAAKNILTVGASRSTRTVGGYSTYTYGHIWPDHFPDPPLSDETVSGDDNELAGFSSRGPCDDSRIKPDVVAPGTDIVSVKSSLASLANYWGVMPGNDKYAIMGGTSMSAPIVAGCAAVVREYYEKKAQHKPSAALVKATIINGCKKLTGEGCVIRFPDLPNFNQGFGMVDMSRTIPREPANFFLMFYDNYTSSTEHFRNTGQRIRIQIHLPSDTWMRICLAYTDTPGRALQNNLNLMLDYNADNTKWTGNEKVPALLKMPDPTNNIETIIIDQAKAGDYTMQITATNIIRGPQDFAWIITTGDINTTTQPK
jgi:serine protease AprX